VLTAPGPEKILPGSDYTNWSTTFFITGKYAEGIPFYRDYRSGRTAIRRQCRRKAVPWEGPIAYSQKELPLAAWYVEHYLLTSDTNAVENAIRLFIAGRNGRLFCGSERGTHAGAGIYSLIETAKATGHEPYRYLCYLFDRLPRVKTPGAINAQLPYNFSPEHTTPMG
jgi:hypothetical protein